ncbi:hypothetical protein GIX45_16065 [Erwinia sp. CPCC 100877]|nr:hypothetical protein [Erwinia sp. CPCC 100877]
MKFSGIDEVKFKVKIHDMKESIRKQLNEQKENVLEIFNKEYRLNGMSDDLIKLIFLKVDVWEFFMKKSISDEAV